MDFKLLIDLHKGGERQGPGSEYHTRLALQLSGLEQRTGKLMIADIGCGTGASSLVLARALDAEVMAIDLFPDFLEVLEKQAEHEGLKNRINPISCAMEKLPFEQQSLDAIWSEGAIYNMGFENGISYFKKFLKPGGTIAVSEITWLTQKRPQELSDYWNKAYPQIATASEKIRILEEQGFALKGYFPLPETCWIDNYYDPLETRFDGFIKLHGTAEAQSIVEEDRQEIAMYHKYKRYFSYGFYVAQLQG